jgi:hypothetical protein
LLIRLIQQQLLRAQQRYEISGCLSSTRTRIPGE